MAKFKTYDEAQEALVKQKEVVKSNRAALDEFRTANGIKKGAELDAKDKNKKAYDKLVATVTASVETRDKIEEEAKALKPAGKRGNFTQKYEYPAEITTAADKKKYRAAQRRASKGDASKVDKVKADKPAKDEKKKEVPATDAAPVKKKFAPPVKKKGKDD